MDVSPRLDMIRRTEKLPALRGERFLPSLRSGIPVTDLFTGSVILACC